MQKLRSILGIRYTWNMGRGTCQSAHNASKHSFHSIIKNSHVPCESFCFTLSLKYHETRLKKLWHLLEEWKIKDEIKYGWILSTKSMQHFCIPFQLYPSFIMCGAHGLLLGERCRTTKITTTAWATTGKEKIPHLMKAGGEEIMMMTVKDWKERANKRNESIGMLTNERGKTIISKCTQTEDKACCCNNKHLASFYLLVAVVVAAGSEPEIERKQRG